MTITVPIFSLIFVVASSQAAVWRGSAADSCLNTLAEAKIERKAFATAVGHGIHSLYLEPLRYL
jgi:hypothetical protein